MADYGNDPNWRAGVTQMRPSTPGPAQAGVTTRETLGLLGRTFRTHATIHRVEPDACSSGEPTTGKNSCKALAS